MINLLPLKEKKNLQEEKRLKFILILGILLLAIFVSFCLILFVIKIIISSQIETQKTILEKGESEFQNSQLKDLQEIINNSNKALSELNTFYKQQFDFSDILEKISKILPPKTYLTNISFNSQIDKDGNRLLACNLSGFSPDRDTLLQFKNNLEKETEFKEVYFPPSNWISPININFSINFKISK